MVSMDTDWIIAIKIICIHGYQIFNHPIHGLDTLSCDHLIHGSDNLECNYLIQSKLSMNRTVMDVYKILN